MSAKKSKSAYSAIPKRAICFLDDDPVQCDQYGRSFKQSARSYDAVIRTFRNPQSIVEYFAKFKTRFSIEPCVLVTDAVGTKPVGRSAVDVVKTEFPSMKIILYCEEMAPDLVVNLGYRSRVIDDYIPKDQPLSTLDSVIKKHFNEYSRHTALGMIRRFIETCPNPEVKFFPDGASHHLSVIDIYWQVLKNTQLGNALGKTWIDMVEKWASPV